MKHWYEYLTLMTCTCMVLACSGKDEPYSEPEGGNEPISFMSEMAERSSTRAASGDAALTNQFTNFRLYGVRKVRGELKDVFDDYGFVQFRNGMEVSGDASADASADDVIGWEYASHLQTTYPNQSRQYWDGKASEYRMIAGAPYASTDIDPSSDRFQLTLSGLDAGFQVVEGLTSTASADAVTCAYYSLPKQVLPEDYGKVVVMTFRYAMSRINIKVGFETEQATDMLIKNVVFKPNGEGQYVNRGGLKVAYEFEPAPKIKECYTIYENGDLTNDPIHFSDIIIPKQYNENNLLPESYWMLPTIPSCRSSWQVDLDVTPVLEGLGEKHYSARIPEEDMIWEPGYAYTYVMQLKDDGMDYISKIQIAIRDWDVADTDNRNFYNW